MKIKTFEQRHSLGGIACPCLGGGGGSSSSSTSTNTVTNNTDKRVVADGGSTVASIDGNGNSLTLTDSGAVKAGASLGLAAIGANSTNLDHLLATADHLISQQQNGMQASIDLTKSLAGTAQTAYADAANQASGNKQLILAAMAVVAVVAFKSMKA